MRTVAEAFNSGVTGSSALVMVVHDLVIARLRCAARGCRSNNVLIGAGGVAKLTDFGLSVIMAGAANTISASEAGSHPHTERWAAPEILDGGDVDEKADVYSFAMLLFEIFSRAVRCAVCSVVALSWTGSRRAEDC